MRKFNSRLALIFAVGLLVFALRELWGMHAVSLTPLIAAGSYDTYTVARWTTLLRTLIWAGVYLAFHTFVVAFLFRKLARMPWRAALVMQAYVVSLLIFEKALLFAVFAAVGYALPVSFLSFGPIAAAFLDWPYAVTLFFNQLTLITAAIVGIQYRYVRAFSPRSPKAALTVILLFHVAAAAIVAAISVLPVDQWVFDVVEGIEGGVSGE